MLVRKLSKDIRTLENKKDLCIFHEEGPRWVVATLPRGWMTVGSGSILLIPNHEDPVRTT